MKHTTVNSVAALTLLLGASLSGAVASTAQATPEYVPASAANVPNCVKPPTPRLDDMQFNKAPRMSKKLPTKWHLQTNCGLLTINLKPAAAPETVNNIRFLTKRGFYDRTACHRLTTEGIFVLQCGDPAGNGTGGPGYSIPDENLPPEGEANYPAGTVAMANAGPGTGGSQFFIVYEDTTLPSGYTIFGRISPEGLKKVRAIARVGAEGGVDGEPQQNVTITHAWTS